MAVVEVMEEDAEENAKWRWKIWCGDQVVEEEEETWSPRSERCVKSSNSCNIFHSKLTDYN